MQTITDAGGIASGETFGNAIINAGTVTISDAGGISSAETFGDAQLNLGLAQEVAKIGDSLSTSKGAGL